MRIIRSGFVVVLTFGAAWAAGALVYDIVHAGAETNSAVLLLRAEEEGRDRAVEALRGVMFRLMTSLPPGRLR